MGTRIEPSRCPQCGGSNVQPLRKSINYKGPPVDEWECQTCAHQWEMPRPKVAPEKPPRHEE